MHAKTDNLHAASVVGTAKSATGSMTDSVVQNTPATVLVSPLMALCLCAGVGIVLALPKLPAWPWPLALLGVVPVLLLWRCRLRPLAWLGMVLLGVVLAFAHALAVQNARMAVQLQQKPLLLRGEIFDLPRIDSERSRFLMRVQQVQLLDADARHAADAQVAAALRQLQGQLVQLSWYAPFDAARRQHQLPEDSAHMQVRAGQVWQMQVRLRIPRGTKNPGGFDAERDAFARRIAAMGSVQNKGRGAVLLGQRSRLNGWRGQLSARIDEQVPSASARYVRALALGDVNGLSTNDWEVLRAVGLTHLIAISGFHVGIVAGFFALWARALWWCFPRLGRHLPRPLAAAVMAVAGAGFYTALVGFEIPTVRTFVMIAVVVLARLQRRHHRLADVLALAAMVMVVQDPLSLLAAGFWLSFLGVAWLLWCLPAQQSAATLKRRAIATVKLLCQTQAVVSIGLLPLTVVFFGQASLAGPLANLIAVPWWSLVIVPLALLGTFVEALWQGAGGPIWRLAAWCFDLSWPLFDALAASKFALYWPAKAPWWAFVLAMLGAFWLLLPRGLPMRWMALVLLLPLLWPRQHLPMPGAMEIVMLDVGQGNAILVRTAQHTLLYDTGPAQGEYWDAGARVVVPALRALGVRHLDAVIVSHDDSDHAGGLSAVQRAYPQAKLWAPPESKLHGSSECINTQRWQWDGVAFEILHPPAFFPYAGNESSCVLRIESAHGTALLLGDIGHLMERRLLRLYPEKMRNTVVLVGHHGSRHSSAEEFVAATEANYALISRGDGNRFGHPHAEVLRHWQRHHAQIIDSAHTGAVRIYFEKQWVNIWRARMDAPRLWDTSAS